MVQHQYITNERKKITMPRQNKNTSPYRGSHRRGASVHARGASRLSSASASPPSGIKMKHKWQFIDEHRPIKCHRGKVGRRTREDDLFKMTTATFSSSSFSFIRKQYNY